MVTYWLKISFCILDHWKYRKSVFKCKTIQFLNSSVYVQNATWYYIVKGVFKCVFMEKENVLYGVSIQFYSTKVSKRSEFWNELEQDDK